MIFRICGMSCDPSASAEVFDHSQFDSVCIVLPTDGCAVESC